MKNSKQLTSDFGRFKLERLPKTDKGDLRPWDAADELLLQHISENKLHEKNSAILIINDAFGALSCALHKNNIHNWSDSFLSHCAAQQNYERNALVEPINCIQSDQALSQNYDLVVIKIPKTLSLLEDQLCQLKPHISADTQIIAGAMSKHIHTSALKLFEKIIGTTTTSRATKKARLIFSNNDQTQIHKTPYPKTIHIDEYDLSLKNHANVFAKDHLDIGSRFLIEQLPHCPSANTIIDLGCGNGVLGIMAQRHQAQAQISFVDESYMAIQSARENYDALKPNKEGKASFHISNCLSHYKGDKAQLILCNPPFHQSHSIGDQIAWQMFKQSFDHLEEGGELWVVANRHLAYHSKLKRLFGNCKTQASNKKFVILVAKKT